MKQFTSDSENETIAVAQDFARGLKPGSVIALSGDLGSGKTQFVKGVAVGLGLKDPDEVKSPTFAIMHIYESRVPVYHFDLYRLETVKEVRDIGFEELIGDGQAVTCVEWPERAGSLMPSHTIHVAIEIVDFATRRIKIKNPAKRKK